ncbi:MULTISPECIES: sensor histidine kinase [Methylobacterium]|uniref:histidine kinase n=2 Tax=Methylobacterium TaxID=407 RepID=A0A1Y0Z8S8_9HYPH|nr:GAF domain-containing protein [Methylobacterium aquaticum]QRE77176.1 GAF domain-containing protein [Methylobacterium aquaticum]BAR47158.1 signal transduction histidine kinase [Methylobacterium aquaticum]
MIHTSPATIRADAADPKRLAALEALDVLDTAPEEGFDDAVQIARLICRALVSLVAANRQWFKARAGFPLCETALDASVCVYALSEPDLLVIPDLAADPRTRGNPLVTGEPHIRFYAGAPLRDSDGQVLGSLCVIDHHPRPGGLAPHEADALRRLARQVMVLLRERRQVTQMQGALERRNALIELGDRLRDACTVPEMTAVATEVVGRTLAAKRAAYGEMDGSGDVLTVPDDWAVPGMASLSGRHRIADYGEVGPVLRRGDTLVVDDVTEDARTSGEAERFAALGIRSLLNVPVRERGRTVGVFLVHDTARRRWTAEEASFARNVADRVQAGIARLRAEERQALLNRELSHRLKNTLAMVQAIAAQTMRNAPDLDAARDALADRLVAMGKAHDILLAGTREGAGLEEVIRGSLAIHDDAVAGRFRLSGPHVRVGSRAALSLALMVHELATNAAKYGALSTPQGCVLIEWSIGRDGHEPVIRLRWREVGGPQVTPPTRRGFGSRLIERGLAGTIGGEVNLAYPAEGVTCDLTASLAEIKADS